MTAPFVTSRLKLDVDPDGLSQVQSPVGNWDKVDFAGGSLITTSGVNIPNAQLYDGAIVTESDTGISWRAVSNGDGTYSKKYIFYPFRYSATDANPVPNNLTFWGWDTRLTGAGNALNSSAANKGGSGNGFIATVKGIYIASISARWASNATGTRELSLAINRTIQNTPRQRMLALSGNSSAATVLGTYLLNVGDELLMSVYQNSAGALAFNSSITIDMVKPL